MSIKDNLVRIQPWHYYAMNRESLQKYPPNLRGSWDKIIKVPQKGLVCSMDEVNTRDKLIHKIRLEYGWLVNEYDDEHPEKIMYVLFFRGHKKNLFNPKKPYRKVIPYYDPEFTCIGESCQYWSTCPIKQIHRKGWSCKANRKEIIQWVPRIKLVLERIPHKEPPHDYRYTILWDKLFYLRWMQDERKEAKKKREIKESKEESEGFFE